MLQQYTSREPILLPNGTCLGDCNLEIVAPGWDVECSKTTKSYQLPTYANEQAAGSLANTFFNGTTRPNSTYHGPKIAQTMFRIEVDYNSTFSSVERLSRASAMQVSIENAST